MNVKYLHCIVSISSVGNPLVYLVYKEGRFDLSSSSQSTFLLSSLKRTIEYSLVVITTRSSIVSSEDTTL